LEPEGQGERMGSRGSEGLRELGDIQDPLALQETQ